MFLQQDIQYLKHVMTSLWALGYCDIFYCILMFNGPNCSIYREKIIISCSSNTKIYYIITLISLKS